MTRNILVVEDDVELAELIAAQLRELDYLVAIAHDGNEGLEKAVTASLDLMILDVVLPGLDGFEICRSLRSQCHYVPILMLTSKTAEIDRVLGLELGADDYLAKPFSMRELTARAKAILRRAELMRLPAPGEDVQLLKQGDITVDIEGRSVRMAGRAVALTQREFDLLAHFVRHPGKVFTRAELLTEVWGYRYKGYEHTVNSHVNRLRSKIEPNPMQPAFILTVWGVGYKFRDVGAGSNQNVEAQTHGVPVSFPKSRGL